MTDCDCCRIIGRGCPTCHEEYATHADWCPMREASEKFIEDFMDGVAKGLEAYKAGSVKSWGEIKKDLALP